jgi:hypothetical protein
MAYELSQERLKAFAREATHFDLIRPVIRVSGNGDIERI